MTRQQADKILKAFTDISACDSNSKEVSELVKELREAVGKQVPRKMKHEKYTDDPYSPDEEYWYCPNCGTDMYNSLDAADYISMEYCPWCGQRIEL